MSPEPTVWHDLQPAISERYFPLETLSLEAADSLAYEEMLNKNKHRQNEIL
jgi:hypothetical protein